MGKSQENFEDISIFSKDWSKQIIPDATIEHLDKSAIAIAREKKKEKMNRSHITEEVDNMTDEEFLTKTKMMLNGKITNAAMLLLGNEDFDFIEISYWQKQW